MIDVGLLGTGGTLPLPDRFLSSALVRCGGQLVLIDSGEGTQVSLRKLGWGVYQTDHEDANSQYEVNFQYTDALTTADRVTFFRMAVSQIAKKYGAIER